MLALWLAAAYALDVCVIVRTCPSQRVQLPALLISLAAASEPAKQRNLTVQMIVVDTEDHARPLAYIDSALSLVNSLAAGWASARNYTMRGFVADKRLYGYDATQIVLDDLLRTADADACAYFLFTNGDNLYNRYVFDELRAPLLNRVDLIGFDFVSHHIGNKLHTVQFEYTHIDLGAALVSRRVLAASGATFFRHPDPLYRAHSCDWTLFEKLLARPDTSHALIHKVLLFHL